MKNLYILAGLGETRLRQIREITASCSQPEIGPYSVSHTAAHAPSNPHFKPSQHWDSSATMSCK